MVKMDKVFKALGGKKFTVWLVSCVFVILKVIPPEIWFNVTMVFIGTHAAQDGLYTYLEGKNHEKNH